MSRFITSSDWNEVAWENIGPTRGFRRASKIIHLVPNSGIHLDVGTGNGDGTALFSQYKRTIGIDFGSKSLKIAKGKKLEVLQADSRALPFKENIFKSITCLDVLEHIPNPEFAIHEIARVLAKDGELILQTPIKESFKERLLLLVRFLRIKKQKQPYDKPLSKNEIHRILHENNLKIISERPIRYWASNLLIHLISISRVFHCQFCNTDEDT